MTNCAPFETVAKLRNLPIKQDVRMRWHKTADGRVLSIMADCIEERGLSTRN